MSICRGHVVLRWASHLAENKHGFQHVNLARKTHTSSLSCCLFNTLRIQAFPLHVHGSSASYGISWDLGSRMRAAQRMRMHVSLHASEVEVQHQVVLLRHLRLAAVSGRAAPREADAAPQVPEVAGGEELLQVFLSNNKETKHGEGVPAPKRNRFPLFFRVPVRNHFFLIGVPKQTRNANPWGGRWGPGFYRGSIWSEPLFLLGVTPKQTHLLRAKDLGVQARAGNSTPTKDGQKAQPSKGATCLNDFHE